MSPCSTLVNTYSDHFCIAGGPNNVAEMQKLRTRWMYNHTYDQNPLSPTDMNNGYHWLPLLRLGPNYAGPGAATTAFQKLYNQPDQWYMIGNEPTQGDQDGVSPSDAADQFKAHYDQLISMNAQPKIVGPGMIFWGDTWGAVGRTWFDQFVGAYLMRYTVKPPIDALNIHLYHSTPIDRGNIDDALTNNQSGLYLDNVLSYFFNDLTNLRGYADSTSYGGYAGQYPGIPIWITEFGALHCTSNCVSSNDERILRYMSQLIARVTGMCQNYAAPMPYGYNLEKWFVFTSGGDR